jgi:uncharacterized protein
MMSASKNLKLFPNLGTGLGLRAQHYQDVRKSSVQWFEALSENYMEDGGRPVHILTEIRKEKPLVLHGVSLSIASVDPLNDDYIDRLKTLIDRVEPSIVSDHCCWTGVNGQNLHDLMPTPFTQEAIDHISSRVLEVQERLGRRILLENVSSYLSFKHSEMTEWDFLKALVEKADCGLLLDVNNVYVSSVNHGFDPMDYIRAIPPERVGQIHLAGHSEREDVSGRRFLIDTHDTPVCDEVWSLYEQTLSHVGHVSTMVEWDANIPSFERLEEEISKAAAIQKRVAG